MARSESQGLQIAVILLTMCVVGLAISTWVYYQAADANLKLKETADKNVQDTNAQLKKEGAKAKAYMHIYGDPTITPAMVEADKALLDPPTLTALDNFNKLMEQHEKAMTNESKGLAPLPNYLIAATAVHSKQFTDSVDRENRLTVDKAVIEKRETGRTKVAEEAQQKAIADKDAERDKFNAERADFKKELEDMKAAISTRDKQLKDLKDKSDKEISDQLARYDALRKDLENMRLKVINASKDGPSFEAPDGQITWVNQRQRMCWIDVGHADGLTRQTTFSVYDHDENGVSSAKRKARVEVIKVVEPHLAECRILEDEIKNPILPGDKIFTPAWSPGQHLHFAINGVLDIDGDGRADNAEVRSIIELNGGVVDAELKPDGTIEGAITIQTRYLIRGKAPSEKEFSAEEGKRAFEQWSVMTQRANDHGVEIIDITRFLNQMGWKAQERTTTLGTKKTATKRSDAGKATKTGAAAAEEEPAAEEKKPAKSTKPATEDDDPFGSK